MPLLDHYRYDLKTSKYEDDLFIAGISNSLSMSWKDIMSPDTGKTPRYLRESRDKQPVQRETLSEKEKNRLECDRKVNVAKAVCSELKAIAGVDDCIVDDWNRYCNDFSLFLTLAMGETPSPSVFGYYPRNKNEFNLRGITAGVKRTVKKYPEADFGNLVHPKRRYDSGGRFDGYDKDHTELDLYVY